MIGVGRRGCWPYLLPAQPDQRLSCGPSGVLRSTSQIGCGRGGSGRSTGSGSTVRVAARRCQVSSRTKRRPPATPARMIEAATVMVESRVVAAPEDVTIDPDAALLERLRTGDEDAFMALVEKYS